MGGSVQQWRDIWGEQSTKPGQHKKKLKKENRQKKKKIKGETEHKIRAFSSNGCEFFVFFLFKIKILKNKEKKIVNKNPTLSFSTMISKVKL